MTYRPSAASNASSLSDTRVNNTGSTILKGTPVRLNVMGELDFVNVGLENEALGIAGLASVDIPNGANGFITLSGKITNITTTAVLGDLVWIAKSGGLTNLKPTIGIDGFVAGDFVIIVGVIGKNQDNPANKDLIINLAIVGQL